MTQRDDLKRKVSKKKVVMSILFTTSAIAVGGLSYKVYKQRAEIKNLQHDLIGLTDTVDAQQIELKDLQFNVSVLKSVMNGNIIHSLKETTKRKLRYAEGRLASGIEDRVMSIVDINKRKEEIEFYSEQIVSYDKAEKLLTQ